ncbi:MAG: aspartate/glutamate racemase family protein [Verrucomicrobiaceae bacterium]|nr:aspartate/glutamate racemase family protein [Verrucomicrobiaceae bacterium]
MKFFIYSLGWFAISACPAADVVSDVVTHARQELAAAPRALRPELPVGVFDSGIGGLTVLEAILDLDAFNNYTLQPGSDGRPDFEHERLIYLGDQANMPYGNYSAAGKTDFLRELILRDALFLLKQRVKAVVIACNTATAYGLDDIREMAKQLDLPVVVIGVVEAGARGVASGLPRELGKAGVGVLATVGTCTTGAYPKSINTQSGQAGKSPPDVCQQGSIGLAGAIEGDPGFITDEEKRTTPYAGPVLKSPEGFDRAGLLQAEDGTWQLNSLANYLRYDLRELLESHKESGSKVPVDRVVLGCTHFPLVQEEILATLKELREKPAYRALVAEDVELINPAELTAKELFRSLAQARLRRTTASNDPHLFYISVPNPNASGVKLDASGKLDRGYQYGRNAGTPGRNDTQVVPMAIKLLPAASRSLVEKHLTAVWAAMNRTRSE